MDADGQEKLGKGGRRREQILAAAVELFGEVGYRGTSLRDIAQRVGITHPGLLYHFHSKQELLSAVLARRDASDGMAFGLTAETTGRDLAQRLLRLAEHNATTPGMIELFSTLSAESTDQGHPAHDFFKERYVKVVAAFQRMFDDMAAAGELRDGVDTDGLGVTFTALMDGLQVQWLYARESVDAPDLLRRYFNAYLKTPLLDEAT
ncbi:MAG TPA: TetR/AcrR family transcriptional regulator [Propionibacterium sp.]|jgi:AcrR family transcriptional regulator|nr:TetR/AcrR family transcriptional regulator [Propionibacterium sp.]